MTTMMTIAAPGTVAVEMAATMTADTVVQVQADMVAATRNDSLSV
jgi:hypothetical protein